MAAPPPAFATGVSCATLGAANARIRTRMGPEAAARPLFRSEVRDRLSGMSLLTPAWRGLSLVAVIGLAPAVASAANGVKERVPVGWENTTCMEFVDRSTNPTYEFHYTIPDEDPSPGEELLKDEVPDSRRFQFFAVCRQESTQRWLPSWITDADVAAAVERELITATTVEDPEDVLETSAFWGGCWERVNADNDRLAITHENAAAGVQWDTTGVPEGTYTLWGYTWEPAFNIWSPRPGAVVKIHDGGDPADIGPGGAITTGETILYTDETGVIEGCANGLPGSTLTGYFASTDGNTGQDWVPPWAPFTEEIELTDGTFALDFMPPADVAGDQVLIRVDITDPMGRTYEAHMLTLISVLGGSATGDCPDTGSSILGGATCGNDDDSSGSPPDTDGGSDSVGTEGPVGTGTGSSASASASGTSGSSPTSPGGNDDGGSGGTCAVTTQRPSDAPAWMWLGLGALLLRRRRA